MCVGGVFVGGGVVGVGGGGGESGGGGGRYGLGWVVMGCEMQVKHMGCEMQVKHMNQWWGGGGIWVWMVVRRTGWVCVVCCWACGWWWVGGVHA